MPAAPGCAGLNREKTGAEGGELIAATLAPRNPMSLRREWRRSRMALVRQALAMRLLADEAVEQLSDPALERDGDREEAWHQQQGQHGREDEPADNGDAHRRAPAVVAADRNGG